MQKPMLLILHQGEALSEFEVALQRFGFEVQICSQLDQVPAVVRNQSPDLVVLDHSSTAEGTKKGKVGAGLQMATASFEQAPDLLAVHEFLQKNLKSYSRRHPRMAVDLPGVFSRQGSSHIASIRNLGTGGAFIKTGCNIVAEGDIVEVAVPLLGMKKELELKGRVVYQITPDQANNYLHGFGVSFAPLDEATQKTVQDYLSYSLTESIHSKREAAINSESRLRSPGGRPKARSVRLSFRN